MTPFEARAAGGFDPSPGGSSGWSRVLVPILTAFLVLAFGLLFVGLTGGDAESRPGSINPPESSAR
jgi:hypothetical protein